VARWPTVLVLALLVQLGAGHATSADAPGALVLPGARDLLARVVDLTAPEMAGRGSATPGGDRAAQRIAQWLAEAGLTPGGDGGTFLQSFPLATGRRLGPGNMLDAPGLPATVAAPRDWMPHGGSASGVATGEVVFAGYGVSDPAEGYDDYAGIDARGAVVLVLTGPPPRLRAPPASRLEKLIAARAHGAAAVLVADDVLPPLDATDTPVALVSGHVTTAVADALLASASTSLAARRAAIAATGRPAPVATGVRARLRVALEREERRAANVVGIVPGADPAHAGEAVVIGAHYDHLGVIRGQIHPGADDNASGTSVVVGLARTFAHAAPARTLVFALFSGEELGLLGSAHYVQQPTRPLAGTVAMLNFDQVGRMRERRLDIGGLDSASGLRPLVEEAAGSTGLKVAARGTPWAPSDHTSFYAARVPVLFFHTGLHPDYHAPTDTADRLDADGMAAVAAVGARIVERLAAGPAAPMYAEVPRKRPEVPRQRREVRRPEAPSDGPAAGRSPEGGVFLGVAVDGHAGELRLARVVSGSAADRAGMRAGDVLVRMAGASIESFDALRAVLRSHRAGDVVPLVYVRDGERHDTSATLGER
jgi:membrane-associated protease RseP (regulator of RpoE activity)